MLWVKRVSTCIYGTTYDRYKYIYIIIIYENSTVRLASVGLAQACPNKNAYLHEVKVMCHHCDLLYLLLDPCAVVPIPHSQSVTLWSQHIHGLVLCGLFCKCTSTQTLGLIPMTNWKATHLQHIITGIENPTVGIAVINSRTIWHFPMFLGSG